MKKANIHYTVSMENPHTHIFHVKIDIGDLTNKTIELYMPTWTPGSYLIREYSKNIISVKSVSDNTKLNTSKINKNTWEIELNGHKKCSIEYDVYAFEMSVRTSFLDSDHAMINGASVFMIPKGFENQQLSVEFEPFHKWNKITTTLKNYKSSKERFIAKNFDELVDSPIEIGNHKTKQFQASNISHEYAIVSSGNENMESIISDTTKILETTHKIFGSIPYEHYIFFLYLNSEGYGGLEHSNSCSMIFNRHGFTDRKSYIKFIGLVSHEFFHTYNVKRIRPKELGPFDYENENYTTLLWIAEGVTSYYDNHILLRSGTVSIKEYLELISHDIRQLHKRPGRNVQSVSDASFDAWIKLYRPDENSHNTSISYYLKGGLIILILDLLIRNNTNNNSSLDDVYQLFWNNYKSTKEGLTEKDFFDAVEKVSGDSCKIIQNYIHNIEELDFNSYLHFAGLELQTEYSKSDYKNASWFGLNISPNSTVISRVFSDGPAYSDGLNARDEIIAINGYRLTSENIKTSLSTCKINTHHEFTISRNAMLKTIHVKPIEMPFDKYSITQINNPSKSQKLLFESWLNTTWDDGIK
jgi:predicted metalloprotease with PDZ domain